MPRWRRYRRRRFFGRRRRGRRFRFSRYTKRIPRKLWKRTARRHGGYVLVYCGDRGYKLAFKKYIWRKLSNVAKEMLVLEHPDGLDYNDYKEMKRAITIRMGQANSWWKWKAMNQLEKLTSIAKFGNLHIPMTEGQHANAQAQARNGIGGAVAAGADAARAAEAAAAGNPVAAARDTIAAVRNAARAGGMFHLRL